MPYCVRYIKPMLTTGVHKTGCLFTLYVKMFISSY